MQDARPRLWQPIPNFPDLPALNVWLEQRCKELWQEIPHGRLAGSVAEVSFRANSTAVSTASSS